MFDTKYEDLPAYVKDWGWQIHLVRTHMRQIVIGAANSGLNEFHLQWEKQRVDGDDRCGSPANIYYNGGWQTRFSAGFHEPAPDAFVALYSDCRSEYYHDTEAGPYVEGIGERLYGAVIYIEHDQAGREKYRTVSYMQANWSLECAEFEGLNFINSAHAAACMRGREDLNTDKWGNRTWNRVSKKHVPSVARQALHKALAHMEGQFGQGKDFFVNHKQS